MASAQTTQRLSSNSSKIASSMVNESSSIMESTGETVESVSDKPGNGTKSTGVASFIDKGLNLLSSVPFGIVLLILLITACMIGMVIQQQELQSFPGYYADLTPAERSVYGQLGFFDIYHVWYFNLLLLLLSLNIILASIDHFPAAWSFISKKKLTASPVFAMAQKLKEKIEMPQFSRSQLVERAAAAAKATNFKVRITEEETRTTLFVERGVWNRLGAYIVHIGLLTIFFGGFMTSRGYNNGALQVVPNQSTNRMVRPIFGIDPVTSQHNIGQQESTLPFTIEGLDIQQKLIDKNGSSSDLGNTLDWLTHVRIHDPETGQKTEALIHMNHPFDYRGYRFFQVNWTPGNASRIKLKVAPAGGGAQEEVEIPRDGEALLKDGTRVQFLSFNPAFTVTREMEVFRGSRDYVNPAAQIAYLTPSGKQGQGWAFTSEFAQTVANAPMMKKFLDTGVLQFTLMDFERVPFDHTLSVQYDPGAKIVYVGFTILCLALIACFFFSHQRLWIVVEDGKIHLGGDANRNRLGFEDRAKRLIALIREPQTLN